MARSGLGVVSVIQPDDGLMYSPPVFSSGYIYPFDFGRRSGFYFCQFLVEKRHLGRVWVVPGGSSVRRLLPPEAWLSLPGIMRGEKSWYGKDNKTRC
jgi:hypothetical protein